MIKQIQQELKKLSSVQAYEYSKRLIPNSLPILGVTIPNLRKLAKKICKEDFHLFLAECDQSSFEIQLLEGIVIATAKMDFQERMNYLRVFVPKIQDWAVCDCLVSSLKCCKKDLDSTLKFLQEFQSSHKEFEVRFVAVMLMTYFINEIYYKTSYQMICSLYLDSYYSKMAVAWYLATLMINHSKEVFSYLDTSKDEFVVMKTISKIKESYRVSDEMKIKVLNYIRK